MNRSLHIIIHIATIIHFTPENQIATLKTHILLKLDEHNNVLHNIHILKNSITRGTSVHQNFIQSNLHFSRSFLKEPEYRIHYITFIYDCVLCACESHKSTKIIADLLCEYYALWWTPFRCLFYLLDYM